MPSHRALQAKRRLTAGVAGLCVLAACIPSAGLAVAALESDAAQALGKGTLVAFTPASVDPGIARLVERTSKGEARLVRFTPAGVAGRPDRSVTVAVRVDDRAAQAITVRGPIDAVREQAAGGGAPALRLTPMRYNLGVARGYQSFAKPATLSRELSEAGIPDLASFRPAPGVEEGPSRFAARIAPETSVAPAAEDETSERVVDVSGSYRLTRNLDVTAGLRVSPREDRLAPLADTRKQDSQAVYVGTQFRF